jgi:hypothetical protein
MPTPAQAVRSVRRAADSAAEEAAARLAGLVAGVPDRRLEQLMRTPLRRVVVETIFVLMPLYLNRTRARGLNLTVRWCVTDAGPLAGVSGGHRGGEGDGTDVFDLVISERRCRVRRNGGGPAPLVTITTGSFDLLRIALGQLNPMQAYFDGRLKLRGDVMQASRLVSLFRIPTR